MPPTPSRTRRPRRVALALLVLGVLTVVSAPASFAAPTLDVSATEGLKTGQTITVDGSGFAPDLKGIAVGQCRVGYEGPDDCNLNGGATFRNADANGVIETVTIKLAESFGDIDCTQEQCVIAAAPLPTTSGPEEVAANTVEVPLYFGDAAPAAPAPAAEPETAAPAAPAAAVPVAPPVTDTAVLTAGAGSDDNGTGILAALIATNVLLAAVGIYLGTRRRPRSAR